MLQDIRANAQGTAAKIIVGLIVLAFALFGVESILLGGGGNSVAEVNGEEISPQELQQAIINQKRRLIAMMGDDIDPSMLDDERLSAQVMESLVQRKLMTQAADGMGLSVSDRQLGSVIAGMEQFQVEGQFSPDYYRAVLADAGFTPMSFKQSLGQDMLIGQVRSGLAGSEFATPAELELNARISAEQRDLRYLTIPLSGFSVSQDVSEEEITAYYEENAQDFLAREAVELEYIELKAADFLEPVDEDLLQDAYQAELQGAQYQTETGVSHILFEQGEDESDAAFEERVAGAQARLASGDDFAAVAVEVSDDIGSRNLGGELGYTSGDAFPAEMEAAIAELEVGQVSGPVRTDAGVHLILVTDRRESEPPSFLEMRERLQEQVGMSEARVNLMRTVETLKDLAFNADNLRDPADELALTVLRSERVARDESEGLFANPALLTAAFSDDVISAGHNSEVIELDRDHWVVLRVVEHHPVAVQPLEEVRDQVVMAVTDRRAREAVVAAAEEALRRLRAGESVQEYANAQGYEWQVEIGAERRSLDVPAPVLDAAFSLAAPEEGNSVVDYVLDSSGDALVFELYNVSPGDLDSLPEPERNSLRQMVSSEYGQVVDNEYRQGLRERADITVL